MGNSPSDWHSHHFTGDGRWNLSYTSFLAAVPLKCEARLESGGGGDDRAELPELQVQRQNSKCA